MCEEIFICLLGPVSGELGGEKVDLGPARQRAVMAVLASSPGRVVTMGRLVAGLWGDDAPSTAEQSVYTYVAGLRRALEPGRRRGEQSKILIGEAGGYRLLLDPRQVDSCVFAELVDTAQAERESGDHAGALRTLDRALALWDGTALSGMTGPFAEAERTRLDELRVSAAEARAEILIHLARPREAIAGLRDLTVHHSLRERPHELLVLALYGAGRPAEALKAFDEARRVLADELGIDPGPGLREAHRLVLADCGAQERAEPVIPRQLPRDLIGFVGRAAAGIRLKALLAPWDDSPPHPFVVISGPPGIGKSALAVRVAHAVKERFPSGQLYINLRGGTPNVPALPAHEIAARLLRGIGTPDDAIPTDPDEAAALWRSRLHGRRLLVLLDDAADLAQVRPFLSTPLGVTVLATSRESFSAGDDCVQLRLGRLSVPEARTMLSTLAGAGRVASDLTGTAALVRLCDGLPLALRIVGARLADHPEWGVTTLAERLVDERERLHELAIGDLAVRSSLAAGYEGLRSSGRPLDRLAARALSLLGLLHVPDFTPDVAAVLLDLGVSEAARALERLIDAHLLDRAGSGRYQFHDLVRLFAGELQPRDWKGPLLRAFGYYAASARHASVLIDPHRVQPVPPVDAVPHEMASPDEARAWVLREEHVLAAAAAQAMSSPDSEIARSGVTLAFALLWHHQRKCASQEKIALNTMALRVGERLGDETVMQLAHGHIAGGLRFMQRTDEAVAHLEVELAIATRLGDSFGQVRALGNLAGAYVSALHFDKGMPFAERQLEVARRTGSKVGERYALLMIGNAHRGAGRPEQAREPLLRLLAHAREAGDRMNEAMALMALGDVLVELGDHKLAIAHVRTASTIMKEMGYWRHVYAKRGLLCLSRAYRALGALDDALACSTEALELMRELGDSSLWVDLVLEEHAAVREALRAAQRA